MAAKRQHAEEPENHERWLVSYADFITLLFAFFVVMYAVSRVDNKKVLAAEQSIKFAMHFEGTGGVGEMPLFDGPPSEGGTFGPMNGARRAATDDVQAVESMRRKLDKKLRPFLQERPESSPVITVHFDGRRLVVRMSAAHFFDPSQAALRPEALPVLDAVAQELASLRRPLRVEGHTDLATLAASRFRDNWELSASRAAAVATYLQNAHRVPGEQLSAAGYAATRPVADNTTRKGREANRRVEMVVEVAPRDPLEVAAK